MGQPEAWKMVRRIARRASLDGAGEISPHSLRVAATRPLLSCLATMGHTSWCALMTQAVRTRRAREGNDLPRMLVQGPADG
jgi:hypothetical protein